MIRPGLVARALRERGADELQQLDESIRSPLAVRRKISVVSLSGGTGCTTVARQLASVLTTKRPAPIVTVAMSGDEMRLDNAGDQTWQYFLGKDDSKAIASWRQTIADAGFGRDVSLTDWGALSLGKLRAVALQSHAVCIVVPNERDPMQRALDVAFTLEQQTRTAFVLAAVDLRRRASWAARRLPKHMPVRSTRMPHDRRAAERANPLVGARTEVLISAMRLASEVIDAARDSQRRGAPGS